tara:strand:- start:1287 stop:1592 length:306 start_codon:yes stop_codon:yes gene_type:complete
LLNKKKGPWFPGALSGFEDKGYPEFSRGEYDEAEIGFLGLVVAGGESAQVLEPVEEALDQVAPVDLCQDRCLGTCSFDPFAACVGIAAPIYSLEIASKIRP